MGQEKGFFARLQERRADAHLNAAEFAQTDYASHASRQDEADVARTLTRRFAGTHWEYRANVRVPDPTAKRRTEIDFVITSPNRVILLELKSWTGAVRMDDDGSIIQDKRDGTTLNHGKLLDKLEDQVEVMRLYNLAKGHADVPISRFLVFYRDNLFIDTALQSRPDVLSYSDLLTHLPEEEEEPNLLMRVLQAIMCMFGFKPKPAKQKSKPGAPTGAILQFRISLDELGSWDVVDLHGGRREYGDILLPDSFPNDGENYILDRMKMRDLQFDVDRSTFKAWFRAPSPKVKVIATGWDDENYIAELAPDLPLLIQPAGASEPVEIAVRHIESIALGYKQRHKFVYGFDELTEDMLIVGKVSADSRSGIFVDIGLRDEHGKVRDARARPSSADGLRKGQRVLVRIQRLLRKDCRVDVSIEPVNGAVA